MFGSLARRERRPVWGAFVVLSACAVAFSVWTAVNARGDAIAAASVDAEFTARTELAPLLEARDLTTVITGERAAELASAIDRSISETGPVEEVRIFSALGRILYSAEADSVGTRPSYLRRVTFEVAGGDAPQDLIRDGMFQTYVPIRLTAGGDVAVAELSQSLDPIVSQATTPWYRMAFVAAGLMLGGLAMVVVTTRASAARVTTPVHVYTPSVPRRETVEPQPTPGEAPLYQHSGFRALEERRQEAERRALAVEQNFRAVQKRLKEALAQVKELEARLATNETQHAATDGEVQALRDQLRETSERLHEAEVENDGLRERMVLRQHELEEARGVLTELRTGSADADELRSRLDAADARAAEMERLLDDLESELDHTTAKFHMTQFSDALREIDDTDLEIEEEDDLFEHPVIIKNTPTHSPSQPSTPQKAH